MKRTGTAIRLRRVLRSVFLAAATASIFATTDAAGADSSAQWQPSTEQLRLNQTGRWASTDDSDELADAPANPRSSSRSSARPASGKKSSAPPVKKSSSTISRWLQPTQSSSSTASKESDKHSRTRVGSNISQQATAESPTREPREFVPATDTKRIEAQTARQAPSEIPPAQATPAAYKPVALPPSPKNPRRQVPKPHPRVAANPQYRMNTGWIAPIESGPQMVGEELPMPYDGQIQEDYEEGYVEGYDEGYVEGPMMESWGPHRPSGPDGQWGPPCDHCQECEDGYYCESGFGCGDSCDVGCADCCEPSCSYDPSCEAEPSCGAAPTCGCNQGGNCCECLDLGLGLHDPEACEEVRFRVPKVHNLMVFGGVHGFKNPYDRTRDSGNFGFHEGFNAGFKVPLTKCGYQVGYQVVHSQLSGDKDTNISDPFTQEFFTAGLFQRTKDGWQYGIAYDWLHDDRWGAVDFEQIRAEFGFVECGRHEVGLEATVHLNNQLTVPPNGEFDVATTFQASDQYVVYYRIHSRKGGEGRVFAGFADDGDGIVGADALLPLHDYWSLQTGFTYIIPDADRGFDGAREEAWNLGINLIWHWKGHARKCHSSPYRPLFNVADNGSLSVDDRP